jgi:uncharacterized protein
VHAAPKGEIRGINSVHVYPYLARPRGPVEYAPDESNQNAPTICRIDLDAARDIARHARPARRRASRGDPLPALAVIALNAGANEIRAEVARTTAERAHGLMLRDHLGASDGMLFVFADPRVQCFWMHDTLIPLSAAFIADDGRIVDIVDMAPRTEASHCSSRPVRFVLEMNQAWFARRGIAAGDFITGEPFTR